MAFRHTRPLFVWLTAWVMLAAAVAPAISQWLWSQRADASQWVEVCSAQGTRWVAVGTDAASASASGEGPAVPQGPGKELAHGQGHCPACLVQDHHPGLPPAALALLPEAPRGQGVPALFLSAPRTLAVWATAQARAPPVLG